MKNAVQGEGLTHLFARQLGIDYHTLVTAYMLICA